MNQLVSHIISYLEYLQNNCKLNITIHDYQRITTPFLTHFLPYRVHSNPYCLYLKTHAEIWEDCIAKQQNLFPLLEKGPFWGTCHCGVTEYLYPLCPNGKVIGFISVSGYRDPSSNGIKKLLHACQKYDLNERTLSDLYFKHLSETMPSSALLDTLIYPLTRTLNQLYQEEILSDQYSSVLSNATDNVAINQILTYIEKNYHRSISIEQLCSLFHLSRSYISHTFKATTGYPVREYINLLRLEEAKKILIGTKMSVTEVSLRVGFSNSNYFTLLFHRYTGFSPTQYRKIADAF